MILICFCLLRGSACYFYCSYSCLTFLYMDPPKTELLQVQQWVGLQFVPSGRTLQVEALLSCLLGPTSNIKMLFHTRLLAKNLLTNLVKACLWRSIWMVSPLGEKWTSMLMTAMKNFPLLLMSSLGASLQVIFLAFQSYNCVLVVNLITFVYSFVVDIIWRFVSLGMKATYYPFVS